MNTDALTAQSAQGDATAGNVTATTQTATTHAIEDPAKVWNEVAAERAGKTKDLLVRQPAGKAKPVATTQAALTTPDTSTNPATPVDPLAEIREKLAELDKLKDRVRNAEGHIGNLHGSQKQMREFMDASRQATQATGGGPTQSAIRAAAQDPQEWANLKRQFPDWALATEKFFESRMPQFDSAAFERSIQERIKGETESVRKEIIETALEAVSPGWKAECKTEGFKRWYASQSKEVQAMGASRNIGDAARMLRLYETSKQDNPAQRLQDQRKQTLQAATSTIKGRAAPTVTKTWDSMTPSERWEYEKRRRAKSNS